MAVEIDGSPIARGEPDGFRMNTATELELVGTSCQRWRGAEASISFMLPCT